MKTFFIIFPKVAQKIFSRYIGFLTYSPFLILLLLSIQACSPHEQPKIVERKFPRVKLVQKVGEALENYQTTRNIVGEAGYLPAKATAQTEIIAVLLDGEIPVKSDSRVLLLTVGSGDLAALFAELGTEVTLVKSSRNELFRAGVYLTSLGYENINIVTASHFNPKPRDYDFIFLENPPASMLEVRAYCDLLANDGQLVFRSQDNKRLTLLTRRAGSLGVRTIKPREAATDRIEKLMENRLYSLNLPSLNLRLE